jgi:tetratricopeptide (TPR) repeat protein
MPRNPPSDIDHVVFTDHSIRRRAAPPNAASQAADTELAPFGGGEVGVRDTGLAYATLALREQNDAYRERGFRLLQEAAARGTADAPALAYLAEFYRDRKDDAHALPLYEQSWRTDSSQSAVAVAIGAYQMQRGNLQEAIRWWKQALAINPALLLTRTNLATALARTGYPQEAQATLREALEFNPSFQEARDLINRIGALASPQ